MQYQTAINDKIFYIEVYSPNNDIEIHDVIVDYHSGGNTVGVDLLLSKVYIPKNENYDPVNLTIPVHYSLYKDDIQSQSKSIDYEVEDVNRYAQVTPENLTKIDVKNLNELREIYDEYFTSRDIQTLVFMSTE